MLVTCEEMQKAEEAAFARGVSAEDLMEQAGCGVAEIVRQYHSVPGTCIACCGKGNNAGDALVAARHLRILGWRVELRLAFPESALGPLAGKKLSAFRDTPSPASGIRPSNSLVILDGLLGLGARGEPRGEIAEAIREINQLRHDRGAWVLSIDLPSGLDGDSGAPSRVCIRADLTAAIAGVKRGLLADQATDMAGRLAIVPLPEILLPGTPWRVSAARELAAWLPPRRFDLHKGNCGRTGIAAGSPGFLGAARLCSAAAVRAGAGLVTLFALPEIAGTLAACCVPEVMVKTVRNLREVLDERLDVLAIGPGLGLRHAGDALAVIRDAPPPVVVDADALNALARDPGLLKISRGPRLLTPHPGEMERLFPQRGRARARWLEDFLAEFPSTLLLKGARTLIGSPGGGGYFNSTGNPGMATGGMGDVLTGVCAALVPQLDAKSLLQAGALGAWLCGRAAEISAFGPGGSPEGLTASSVLEALPGAFRDLRNGVF